MIEPWMIEDLIKTGLKEDITYLDAATDYLIPENHFSRAVLIAKAGGTLAGIDVFMQVFKIIDSAIDFKKVKKDGTILKEEDIILEMSGRTRSILKGERLALNFLQRMSGIATMSKRFSDLCGTTRTRIVDTRKTTPGLRILEKYAVTVGGCYNHRYNLSDAMMIKDNHIQAVGSIQEAVRRGREKLPHTMKIEVEVKNLDELEEAIASGADIVMLDNMDIETMKKAVQITKSRVVLEASGGIKEETIAEVAQTGIDIISVGALTHSYDSLDISLLIKS
jgi:nicotinate-nucleotide pyrophosphorylase (carboxylating)